ncbi:MAG: ChaN family lipoprotein [Bacteroidota bacterium]
MKRIFLVFMLVFLSIILRAQSVEAYQLYTSTGEKVEMEQLFQATDTATVVLFGELHNNPVAHWAQIKLLKYLHQNRKQAVLGMEMLEADNQLIVDEYRAGFFDAKRFEEAARLWPNYSTDYKPLVEYGREHDVPVVATNIPRRYANMVSKEGFDVLEQLSEEAQGYMAPLPIVYDASLPGYQKMLTMMQGGPMGKKANANFPKAQAIKDASMAHFIVNNLPAEGVFLHLNGTYHSDNYEGIFWYLKKYQPAMKVLTIATRMQNTVHRLKQENQQVADFILVVDEDVTGSY